MVETLGLAKIEISSGRFLGGWDPRIMKFPCQTLVMAKMGIGRFYCLCIPIPKDLNPTPLFSRSGQDGHREVLLLVGERSPC